MQNGNFIDEHLVQIGCHRRRQPNFRNQQDGRASRVQHLSHTSQIYRRLARPGDAMQQQPTKSARGNGLANLRQCFLLRRAELELKRRRARPELRSRKLLRPIDKFNQPAPHQCGKRSARHIQPAQNLHRQAPARSSQRLNQSPLVVVELLCRAGRACVVTGLWPVLPGGDVRCSIGRFSGLGHASLHAPQNGYLHQARRIARRRYIFARNPLLSHHAAQQ